MEHPGDHFYKQGCGRWRERVDQLVGFGSESIWVSTFHSMCVQDFTAPLSTVSVMIQKFTIYDTDDQEDIDEGSL